MNASWNTEDAVGGVLDFLVAGGDTDASLNAKFM